MYRMLIINVTPDSFYSPSRAETESALRSQITRAIAQKADILDIGGCSTRPMATVYPTAEEEWQRVRLALTVIQESFPSFRQAGGRISIDTFRPEVVARAISEFDADIINDVSGGTESMDELLRAHKAVTYVQCFTTRTEKLYEIVCPADIQPTPPEHLEMADVIDYLSRRIDYLHQAGIGNIWVDPAFGFGMTVPQARYILENLRYLQILDCPILIGLSHKRMTQTDGIDSTKELEQTALEQGASIIRTHVYN